MSDVAAIATQLEAATRSDRIALRKPIRYARGSQALPWLPENVDGEYRDIAQKSATNWIDLVLRAQTQGLYATGWGTDEPPLAWTEGWQRNGMDSRQGALYMGALVCGSAWILHQPTDDGGVWIRPESAHRIAAEYAHEDDEWPVLVLRMVSDKNWELYDETAVHTLQLVANRWTVTSTAEHGLGVCPAVRIVSSFDLLGKPIGEVTPLIPIQDRIVDATFTLQMTAKYGAFPQRFIAGLDPGEPLRDAEGNILRDADGQPIMPKIRAYVDAIISASDPETKFGSFPAASLDPYVNALDAHIRHLAAVSQTPPHYLLGSLVNLSAESLAAAENGLQRRIRERRETFSEGLEQSLRLVSLILGDAESADDDNRQITWQDVESRSLAQVADAMLKLRDVGVPVRKLFSMIPGWTSVDVDEAINALEEGGGLEALMREMVAGQTSPDMGAPPVDEPPEAA